MSSCEKFAEDELIILGSGGGRYMTVSQRRSTGGLILRAMQHQVQIHIDPGPGAIRDVHTYQIEPYKTTHLLLTHGHTDHAMSIPVMIEAMHYDMTFHKKHGVFVAPKDFIDRRIEPFHLSILAQVCPMEPNQTIVVNPGFTIHSTPAYHRDTPSNGYILEFGKDHTSYHYKIAFTSDTEFFKEYTQIYKGVDVLVANILHPDDLHCGGHLCIDEFLPLLQEIHPKLCVLIHFGARMDHEKWGNLVPEQVKKLQEAIGSQIKVIGAEDGQRIQFKDYC
jgi:ribonuclease BN (tRNA processing enzyme)